MAAKDRNGRAFEEGKAIKVVSDGTAHPGGDNPAGEYVGVIIGVHEDGPHVQLENGARTTPFAVDCEVL